MELATTRLVISGSMHSPDWEIATLDVRTIRLAPKVAHYAFSIDARLRMHTEALDSSLALDLWADIAVHDANGSPRQLGRATLGQPLLYEVNGVETPQRIGDPLQREFTLELAATRDQMAAIERLRDGGDLSLRLSPGGTMNQGGLPQILYASNHLLTVSVPQSEWARQIQSVGYSDVITVELRLPVVGGEGDLAPAVRALRKAQRAYLRGDYEETVADCREGFKLLAKRGNDKFDLSTRSKTAGKDERFWRVCRALQDVTHAAHHPEDYASGDVDEAFAWERADASAVVTMLAALISRRSAHS